MEENIENLIRESLKAYGVLNVRRLSRGEGMVYMVGLMSLPLIIQNTLTIALNAKGFTVSSGMLFDLKDTPEEVASRAEFLLRQVAEKRGLTPWKAADSLMLRKEGRKLEELPQALVNLVEAVKELNNLFSEEPILDECLQKKWSNVLF